MPDNNDNGLGPWDPAKPHGVITDPNPPAGEVGPADGVLPTTEAQRQAIIAELKVKVAEAVAISQEAGQTWQQIAQRIASL